MSMPGLKTETDPSRVSERRKSPRMAADYPIFIRFLSASGKTIERYSQTRNVSAEGLLCVNVGLFEPGTRVEASVGVPSLYVPSLPAAQIDCIAKVVRSEIVTARSGSVPESLTALEFVETPTISMRVSMFD